MNMIVRPPNVSPAHQRRLKRMLTRLLDRAHAQAEKTAIGLHRTIITQDGTANPTVIPDLAGDVIGSIIANTIALIRGTPVSGVAPTDGQVLVYNEDSGQAEWGAPGDPSGAIIDYSSLINEARVVRGATATASSESSVERVAEFAIDSDDATFWLTEPENAPTDPSAGAWLRVDLGSAKEITYYRVVQPSQTQFRATSSKLQSSTDDSTWTDRATFGIFGDSGLEELPAPITARYWRVLGVETDPLLFALNYWGLATVALYSGQPTTQAPGHVIQDEGVSLTQRNTLNFVGSGVAVTDDAGDAKTLVTVTAGAATTRWELLTDGSLDGFVWAEEGGVHSLIYTEVAI